MKIKTELQEKEIIILGKHDDTNYARQYEVIKKHEDSDFIDVKIISETRKDKNKKNEHDGALGVGRIFIKANQTDFVPFL